MRALLLPMAAPATLALPFGSKAVSPRWADAYYLSTYAVATLDAAAAAYSPVSLLFLDAFELLWSILTAA